MAADPAASDGRIRYASWWARAGALLLDSIGAGAVFLVLVLLATGLASVSSAVGGIAMVMAFIAAVSLPIHNYCFLQSWNGATVGKHMVGIAVVRDGSHGRPPTRGPTSPSEQAPLQVVERAVAAVALGEAGRALAGLARPDRGEAQGGLVGQGPG